MGLTYDPNSFNTTSFFAATPEQQLNQLRSLSSEASSALGSTNPQFLNAARSLTSNIASPYTAEQWAGFGADRRDQLRDTMDAVSFNSMMNTLGTNQNAQQDVWNQNQAYKSQNGMDSGPLGMLGAYKPKAIEQTYNLGNMYSASDMKTTFQPYLDQFQTMFNNQQNQFTQQQQQQTANLGNLYNNNQSYNRGARYFNSTTGNYNTPGTTTTSL